VRYDTRGHGRSGKSVAEEAWQSRRFSEDFEAVCKEFGIKETYVLGWSAGGMLLNFIERYQGHALMRL
jgi:pimeloyl-ACP methyl ester carboxylesterase